MRTLEISIKLSTKEVIDSSRATEINSEDAEAPERSLNDEINSTKAPKERIIHSQGNNARSECVNSMLKVQAPKAGCERFDPQSG